MPQRAAERTGGIGVDEVCRPSWTKSACSVGATRGRPPLGRGFPPRPSRALGVSDWPLCLLSCVYLPHWLYLPHQLKAMRGQLEWGQCFRHFILGGTALQTKWTVFFYLHGVLVREEGNKIRKIRSMLGKLRDGVGVWMVRWHLTMREKRALALQRVWMWSYLPGFLQITSLPPSLLFPSLHSFLLFFLLSFPSSSVPPFFLPLHLDPRQLSWLTGNSFTRVASCRVPWLRDSVRRLPSSQASYGMLLLLCVQMSSSASIINGAALGFSIILSAWLLTSPTWGLPSPCQAVPSRISGHYRTIPAAKLYHFFIYQFPCPSPIQGNLWEKFSASSPTILQGLKTSLWRTEIRSQKWIYSNKYISILFST